MRDNFYHWLLCALLGALFLGAAIVRGEGGLLNEWQRLTGASLLILVGVAGTISHYRARIDGDKQGAPDAGGAQS